MVSLVQPSTKQMSFLFKPSEKDTFDLVNLVVGLDNVTIGVVKQQVSC